MGKAESLARARAKHLLDNFRLIVEDWETLNIYQKGVCWICGRPNVNGRRLSTDHNHETGEVRGLLCSKCNPLLGKLENAFKRYGLHKVEGITLVIIVRGILRYLENPPARTALGRIHIGYSGKTGTKAHRKRLKKERKIAPHTEPLLPRKGRE